MMRREYRLLSEVVQTHLVIYAIRAYHMNTAYSESQSTNKLLYYANQVDCYDDV